MFKRGKCVFCNHDAIEVIQTIRKFPIYMGASESQNYKYEDLIFGKCKICKKIQLVSLIDIKLLYEGGRKLVGRSF